jgi:hypothetical protein
MVYINRVDFDMICLNIAQHRVDNVVGYESLKPLQSPRVVSGLKLRHYASFRSIQETQLARIIHLYLASTQHHRICIDLLLTYAYFACEQCSGKRNTPFLRQVYLFIVYYLIKQIYNRSIPLRSP